MTPPSSLTSLIAEMREAMEAAAAVLRSIEWNDSASEDRAYDVRRELEAVIDKIEILSSLGDHTYEVPEAALADPNQCYEMRGLESDYRTVALFCLRCRKKFPEHSDNCSSLGDHQQEGMRLVSLDKLEPFLSTMQNEVIPRIIDVVHDRQRASEEARRWYVLARSIAGSDPMVPSEIDGSLSCYFCSAAKGYDHEHECTWTRARVVVSEQEQKEAR